jgi:hypothetical protein
MLCPSPALGSDFGDPDSDPLGPPDPSHWSYPLALVIFPKLYEFLLLSQYAMFPIVEVARAALGMVLTRKPAGPGSA